MAELNLPAQIDLKRFLSIQSHDLKTPFNHIIGFSRVMLKGQDGPLTDLQREDLTTIYNSGMRALGWLNALVEAARLSAGEKTHHLVEVDIRRPIETALAQWKKANPIRNIGFDSQCACTHTIYRMDELQICQAIVSLITCAAEFVTKAARIVIKTEDEPGWLVITIQSMGEKAPTHSALDLELHGYLGRVCIEQHRGVFRVLAENEDGATICFALPRS